jgi:formylglycine-generating enzyme required for sulfatase activity
MTANVWEWVQSPYLAVGEGQQVIRGGAFDIRYSLDYRLAGNPSIPNMSQNTGIRCAADEERVDPELRTDDVFDESFANTASGWPQQIQDRYIFNYHPVDWYHLQLNEQNTYLPVFYQQQQFDSFILETDVYTDMTNTEDAGGQFLYGLAIRNQDNSFYGFLISAHDKMWQIVKGPYDPAAVTGPAGGLTVLAQGSGPSFINGAGDNEIDRLAVIADGPGFTFSINGQLATRIEVDDYTAGYAGLVAVGQEGIRKIHIHYDRISAQPIGERRVMVAVTGAEEAPAATEPAGGEATPVAVEPPAATPTPSAPLPVSRGMVKVDPGTFQLGSGLSVALGEYWIDAYEVTNEDYQEFLDRTGGDPPAGWDGGALPAGKEDHPVHGVTWDQASAYCEWIGKRLPAETEWEAAARGPYAWLYPWGNEEGGVPLPTDDTYPVGSIPENRSFYGAFDMAGNVWEWVQDPYNPVSGTDQVIRGGAYNFLNDMLERLEGDPTSPLMNGDTGFRCAAGAVREVEQEGLLLDEDFVDTQGEWFQARAPAPVGSYFFGYHPTDFYHLQVDAPQDCLSVVQPTPFDNFMVEVEMFTADTETDDGDYGYGMVVRETENNRFYAVLIYPRSHRWQVVKSTPEGLLLLDEGEDPSITGDTSDVHHRLFAVAQGPQLEFFVNGMLALRVLDADYPSGNLGFIVKTETETYTHAHYDVLRVWPLPAGMPPASEAPSGPQPDYELAGPVCQGTVSSADTLSTFVTHQVAEGETWIEIANRYNLTVEEVMAANGRSPDRPGTLRAGASLVIPAPGG